MTAAEAPGASEPRSAPETAPDGGAARPWRADGRDRRLAVWLGAGFFLFYGLFAHGNFAGTDELGVYLTTHAIYRTGGFALPPGTAKLPHVRRGREGRLYSHFAVGQAILALPFYGLGHLARSVLPESWLATLNVAPVVPRGHAPEIFAVQLYPPAVAALLVAVFFLLQRRLGVGRRAAVLASVLLGATTYVATHSVFFLRHETVAVCILGALHGFLGYRQGGSWRHLALGSACASLIILVRVPGLLAGLGLAAYLGTVVVERWRRDASSRRPLLLLAAVGGPFAFFTGLHLLFNYGRWGMWLESPMLSQRVAFENPFYVGAFGLLLSPGASVFLYSPLLVVAPAALRRFWERHRAECVALLLLCATYLVVYAKFVVWTGLWSAPGPRYLLVFTPLLLLPLGGWLERTRGVALRVAVGLLALVGLGVQVVLMAADWQAVIRMMDWERWAPGMRFVFLPDQSPVLGCARGVGQGLIDVWLWQVATGAGGARAHPVLATGVALAIVVGIGFCSLRVRRELQAAGPS